jgi:hypothetical protein
MKCTQITFITLDENHLHISAGTGHFQGEKVEYQKQVYNDVKSSLLEAV